MQGAKGNYRSIQVRPAQSPDPLALAVISPRLLVLVVGGQPSLISLVAGAHHAILSSELYSSSQFLYVNRNDWRRFLARSSLCLWRALRARKCYNNNVMTLRSAGHFTSSRDVTSRGGATFTIRVDSFSFGTITVMESTSVAPYQNPGANITAADRKCSLKHCTTRLEAEYRYKMCDKCRAKSRAK